MDSREEAARDAANGRGVAYQRSDLRWDWQIGPPKFKPRLLEYVWRDEVDGVCVGLS